jgi:uncharacterized protein with LGFP repeats
MALPAGQWDTVSVADSSIRVAGWALDPDTVTAPVRVQVDVDGSGAEVVANGSRPDVAAAFPGAGDRHGFSSTVRTTPGAHSVCLYAMDIELTRRTALGCRSVVVPFETPAEAIQAAWVATGAATGPLGASLGDAQGGLVRGGYHRQFQDGAIYWSATTGSRVVLAGPLRDDWVRRGAEGGELGYPTGDTVCGLVDSGCRQDFENGALYSSATTGVYRVSGPILGLYQGSNQGAWLGYPAVDAVCGLRDGGCVQEFQHGLITWSQATGAATLSAAVAQAWKLEGAEQGALGYPTWGTSWGGYWQTGYFQHGEIAAHPADANGPFEYEVTLY